MAIEKILTHKNGVAEYIITSAEDLKELVDVEVGSRARLLSPIEVRDYIYCGKWAEVKREDSYGDNEIEGIIDDINGEIMDNAVETVNEYHKNLDSLVDCTVTEFEGRDITINPSIEGKTKNVVVKGETYQNLWDINKVTLNTFTTKNNGYIKIDASENNVYVYGGISLNNVLLKPNTTYTFITEVVENTITTTSEYGANFMTIVGHSTSAFPISSTKIEAGKVGIFVDVLKTRETFDDTVNIGVRSFLNYAESGYVKYRVILLEGDYTNSYIPPYFEGIVGVGDKSKNLFNPKEAVHEYVDSTGKFFSSNNNVRTNYILIKPNTPYIGKSLEGSTLNNYSWFDKNKTFIKRDAVEGYAISPNNAMYLIYHNKHGDMGFTVDLSSVKIQLEEGTVSTPYEPYYDGHKTEILSCGKNLFDGEILEGYTLNGSGQPYIATDGSNPNSTKNFIKVLPNTKYCISGVGTTSSTKAVCLYDNNYNFIQRHYNPIFTTPSNAKYIKVAFLSNLQIEINNATPYEPYKEDKIRTLLDELLMKLPSGVCDTIEQRDDGVYLVKRVGKVVLDGSEDWSILFDNNNTMCFTIPRPTNSLSLKNYPNSSICDTFICDSTKEGDFEHFYFGSAKSNIYINKSRLETSDVVGFKTWLSSNNVIVYYQLATPIETKLDIPTVNITTFKDVTHISTTNKVQPIINFALETTNISKDANQYFSIENNKNFILPNMDNIENNSIKELNLYMDIKGEYALTFPSDIKWSSNVINLNKVDYMSILLKYIKVNDVGLWLGNIRGIKNNYNLVTRYTYFGDDVLPEMPSDYEYTIEYVVNDDGSKTRTIRSVNGTLPSTCSFRGMTTVTDVDYYNVDSNCTSLASIFDGCTSLMNVNFADNIDTSNVTDMKRMFYKCSSLLYLDLSNFNTSKVRDMARMFYGCKSLRNLNLSNLDTSMATNMTHMFNGCSNLIKLDLSNFNTAKVTNMSNMFQNCSLLKTLDLSNFNTNLVTNMGGMFYNCSSLTSLDLTIFDTGLVTNMGDMFGNCKKISLLDLSSFNTSSTTGISNMLLNIPTTAIIKVSSTFTKTESDCGWSGTFTIVS